MIETGNISTNKKAFRDFHFFDRWECGLELKGGEVKSIRLGNVNFKDSFARVDGEEIFLYNLHILPYAQASFMNEDPDRPRKLLLHKKEIKKILGRSTQKGLVLIPTKLYFNKRGFAKVEIALGQGKKVYDKREDIKKREADKQIDRAIKQSRSRS
jgi:SsrA-binding protein